MKVFFKRSIVEYDEVEIDMLDVDFNYNGDILKAVKDEDYGNARKFNDYQILDYQLSEKELNKNISEKSFEDICKYRNMNELNMCQEQEDERIKFWNYMR